MNERIQPLDVALPGFRATRAIRDRPFFGLKERFTLGRIEAGRSEFWTRGHVWTGRPGTLLIQQAGDVHRDLAREGPMTYQLVYFPTAVVEGLGGRFSLPSSLAEGDERGRVFHRLLDAILAGAEPFALQCLMADCLVALAHAGTTDDRPGRLTRPVRRALALMREKLAEGLSLDELATHAGWDKFHLCRAFRSQVGMPPHAYLTHLRVVLAKELLSSGAKPKDVAPQVGLYDQSQLNRHFRRIVGVTPGQFARDCGRPLRRAVVGREGFRQEAPIRSAATPLSPL